VRESQYDENDFELLCPEEDVYGGEDFVRDADVNKRVSAKFLSRQPLSEYERCSWGISPGNAVVVSSAMDMDKRYYANYVKFLPCIPSPRYALQQFLQKAAERYGGQSYRPFSSFTTTTSTTPAPRNPFDPFRPNGGGSGGGFTQRPDAFGVRPESADEAGQRGEDPSPSATNSSFALFGGYRSSSGELSGRDLLFSDAATALASVPPGEMSYKTFLGRSYGPGGLSDPPQTAIEGVRNDAVG